MMNITGASSKILLMATRDFIHYSPSISTISLTRFRTLTYASSSSSSDYYTDRLVSNPPDLIGWVRKEGGFVHKGLKLVDEESNGIGLVSSEDIPKGSDLISLPSHLPLKFQSLESGDEDSLDSVLIQLARQVPGKQNIMNGNKTEELWAMKLGLKLLQERATVGSFWWPYISNLPQTYTVPIFFPGEDIKNLQYAPLLYQVNKRCRFLLDFGKDIKHALDNVKPDDHPFGGQGVDASALGWAMSAVSSRAFRLHGARLPDGAHSSIPMMLPLIDMCNHSFQPNAKIFQEEETKNSKMLVKVGLFLWGSSFVPSNPYDTIELKYDGAFLDAASMAVGITSPNFSAPKPWQQQILSQLKLHGEASDLKVSLGGPELVEGRLLAALRVLLATDVETVEKHDLNTLKSLSVEAPLGIPNEVATLRTVIALCLIALEHFPTKIMEDEALLKKSASPSTNLSLQLRIQKKSVIIDVMRNLTRRLNNLSSTTTTNQG
ncbi:hypothetical protein C5167_023225 [Papaver somniferum]|uniref:Rubisco LSMT substrate-binding domain-containing protein n=1 Tax=Papaver somniferum TaxID=3469 RepID=A0A4Y7JL56_PAPSO|nr:hypothetical protein C5167_023225 [Papaver somniferum]